MVQDKLDFHTECTISSTFLTFVELITWIVLLQTSIKATAAPSQVAEPVQATTVAPAPAPASGVCTRSGYVRDPSNCQVFYYCDNVNGQYSISQFNCPAGTVFDTSLNVCNYPDAVQCWYLHLQYLCTGGTYYDNKLVCCIWTLLQSLFIKRYKERCSTHSKPSHLHWIHTMPSVGIWIKLLNTVQVMYTVMSAHAVYSIIVHRGTEVTSNYRHWGHVTPLVGQSVIPNTWKTY